MFRIESLLSARLFLSPQLVGDRLYFVSNLSGHLNLYRMNAGGSVPEPLLPAHIAMQNPHLLDGPSFVVFHQLGLILVLLDHDGDENYQPMLIPLAGGFPEPAFGHRLNNKRVHITDYDAQSGVIYLVAESRQSEVFDSYMGDVQTGELVKLASSPFGQVPHGYSRDHKRVFLVEEYTVADSVLSIAEVGSGEQRMLFGRRLADRQLDEVQPLTGFNYPSFTPDETGVLMLTTLIADTYQIGYLDIQSPADLRIVPVKGEVHQGAGEMVGLKHLTGNRYAIAYNIDGVSWLYEAEFDAQRLEFQVLHVLVGQGELANGYLQDYSYDPESNRFALAFSSATMPTQLYTIEDEKRCTLVQHTNERLLGVETEQLSPGEDASFVSFDGTRISARLYLPSEALGVAKPYPLVYYIHGGPQSQERPDFAWFSMPLIQFLTLNGFAVFVPNVRGSTGYGIRFTKLVDRDWGGQDRLDHVHAVSVLRSDPHIDTSRMGVVGRSYGGYMTLTLAARHPELWKAAVDMFGPFDLISFFNRIPETWKPYFRIALGDPETDRDFLVERSPKTHIDQIQAPLLVIQGKNDPRVVEQESSDLVAYLKGKGKSVSYLLFENEGHDVLKFENRVAAYNTITDFFRQHLNSVH